MIWRTERHVDEKTQTAIHVLVVEVSLEAALELEDIVPEYQLHDFLWERLRRELL